VVDARNSLLHGRAQFDLHIDYDDAGDMHPELSLLVGILDADASVADSYYPRLNAMSGVTTWLDGALLGGRVTNSGLIYRGYAGGKPKPAAARTLQAFFQFADAELRFLQDWPPVAGSSGLVLLSDGEADVWAGSGDLAGIRLGAMHAEIRPDAGRSWLSMHANAATEAGNGLNFLRDSPLQRYTGGFMQQWHAEGELSLVLALRLPLTRTANELDVTVAALGRDVSLNLPEYALDFSALKGLIVYDTKLGLQSDSLTGQLFGYPVEAVIDSPYQAEPGLKATRVAGLAKTDVRQLREWPLLPAFTSTLLEFAEGSIDFDAELLLIPGYDATSASAHLNLMSTLEGTVVVLPEPFAKTAEMPLALTVDLSFQGEHNQFSVGYGDVLRTNLQTAGKGLSGTVWLGEDGDEPAVTDNQEALGLIVGGQLGNFELLAWQPVFEAFKSSAGAAAGSGQSSLPGLVTLKLSEAAVLGQVLTDVLVELRPAAGGWNLFLDNDVLRGHLGLPFDPVDGYLVNLDYLRLPVAESPDVELPDTNGEAGNEPVDVFAGIDPRTLPLIRFETQEFSRQGVDLGSWSFTLRPAPDGAEIADFRIEMDDARIIGRDEQSGASMRWQMRRDGSHETHFEGLFAAGNLSTVMPRMGINGNVVSREARMEGQLRWPGSPAAFALKRSSGQLSLNIRNGRFVDIDSGSSRLLDAFTFDGIIKRLQLDFSDLYERGFAYDYIEGSLGFEDGLMTTEGQLVVQGITSKISIDGKIDLQAETIQADMLVGVPLTQNISVLAGLLGAWPLALSTYVATKIFQEQMADFNTILYKLNGPWDNPTAGFLPSQEIGSPPASGGVDPGESLPDEP
jgi:uncharacterized protein (TIGR02099 family)